ncbi:MAG: hypothetical protein GY757_18090 [bacterium]|nr:hypothetical protein [bacterium]
MDDSIGGLFGGLLLLIVVLAIVKLVLEFLYKVLLLLFSNIIVIAEKLFATWTFLPPFLSWAIVGFLTVTLLYFAIIETGKLSRPALKPLLIVLALLLFLGPVFW